MMLYTATSRNDRLVKSVLNSALGEYSHKYASRVVHAVAKRLVFALGDRTISSHLLNVVEPFELCELCAIPWFIWKRYIINLVVFVRWKQSAAAKPSTIAWIATLNQKTSAS